MKEDTSGEYIQTSQLQENDRDFLFSNTTKLNDISITSYQLVTNVAADRTEKSQRQFNIAPQQFIVPQTKRHNYHGT